MNRKHLSVIMAAGLAALLASCSDNTVEAGDQAIQSNAKLNAVVIDAVTYKPIQGAKVSILANGGNPTSTDANGFAYAGDARVGAQILLVEAETYAPTRQSVNITPDGTNGISIAGEYTEKVYLRQLTAKLEGSVFYKNKEGASLPANGAKIAVIFGTGFVLPPDTVEAGTDGKYVFDKLPAGATVIVKALDYKVGDITYVGESSSVGLNNTGTTLLGSFTYSTSQGSLFIEEYTEEIVRGTNSVVFKFNEPVDITKGSVTVSGAGISQQPNMIWSDNNKTLTLNFEGLEIPAATSSFTVEFSGLILATGIDAGRQCTSYGVIWPGNNQNYYYNYDEYCHCNNRISYNGNYYCINYYSCDYSGYHYANECVNYASSPFDNNLTIKIKDVDIRDLKVPVVKVTPTPATLTATTLISQISVKVEWNALAGANSYEIYAKATKGNNTWTKQNGSQSCDGDKCSFSSSLNDLGFPNASAAGKENMPFDDGGKIEFAVLGVGGGSSTNKTKLSKLEAADIKSIAP